MEKEQIFLNVRIKMEDGLFLLNYLAQQYESSNHEAKFLSSNGYVYGLNELLSELQIIHRVKVELSNCLAATGEFDDIPF